MLWLVAPTAAARYAEAPKTRRIVSNVKRHTRVVGKYKSHQPGPYRSRRKTSQAMVVTRIQKALSRYQVSDFCECRSVETKFREDDRSVSRSVYDSERLERAAVD